VTKYRVAIAAGQTKPLA